MAKAPNKTNGKVGGKGGRREEVELDDRRSRRGGKLKWLLIGVAALVLVAGGVGAAVTFFLWSDDGEPGEVDFSSAPWNYRALDPITVNLDAPGRIRFLRVTVTFAARNPAVIAAIEAALPAVENDVGVVLADQRYARLNTPEGKDELREALRIAVNRVLEARGVAPELERVLLTDLVMQ